MTFHILCWEMGRIHRAFLMENNIVSGKTFLLEYLAELVH